MHIAIARFAASAAALALLTVLPAGPVVAADPGVCRVHDVEQRTNLATLQAAVDAADPGDHLVLRGVCHGLTTIDLPLTVTGIRPKGAPRPTVHGDALGTTIITTADATHVRLVNLRITGGDGNAAGGAPYGNGGGIANSGPLVLRNVLVDHNVGHCGGGISAQAPLRLTGLTVLRDNHATQCGGAIDVDGSARPVSVALRDHATVRRNVSDGYGGGINVWGQDSAVTLTLRDASSVTGNTSSPGTGGGVHTEGGTLTGVTCGAGKRVHDNTPADCVSQ